MKNYSLSFALIELYILKVVLLMLLLMLMVKVICLELASILDILRIC